MTETLTYRSLGDYRVPNLTLPAEEPAAFGKYALLREKHLKQHRRVLYLNLLTAGSLSAHLAAVEQAAAGRVELLTRQMAAAQGVTEQMKASDQMKWVGMMNNIRHSAEEAILSDLIYA